MNPKIYTQKEHEINASQINADALYVISELQHAGFTAYLVGGGVRDLLIGTIPKDFDISTSATPEEIKRVFRRNCIIIGKRFRLAHIRFGKHILEVSTFRSGDQKNSDLIVHDNTWGTQEEDVLRRDFTVNGLFYDPSNNTIIDYVNGVEDLKKNTLHTIGDPVQRFKQDPVRMLRLLKFHARFNFKIDSSVHKALTLCKNEITKSSRSRILEELFKMLESGAAAPFFKNLTDHHFLELIMPAINSFVTGNKDQTIFSHLKAADQLNLFYKKIEKPILTRALLFSCLLFPILKKEIETKLLKKKPHPNQGDIILVANTLIKQTILPSFFHFPKRITATICYILTTQYQLIPLSKKTHLRPSLCKNKEFPFALHFLKLRSLLNKDILPYYETWKKNYWTFRHHRPKYHRSHKLKLTKK